MRRQPEIWRALVALERLAERHPDGFLGYDHEFRIVLWSPVLAKMFGIDAEDALGRDLFAVLPFLREGGEDKSFRAALRGAHKEVRGLAFALPETGRAGTLHLYYSPILSDEGEVGGGLAVIRDATAEEKAREQFLETESRFRRMADNSPVLLWMSGPNGLCNFFNQTWLEFTGRTLAEEYDVGWAEGVHHEDFQYCIDTYMAAFKRRESFEMEYRLRRADGEYRWILDRGAPRYSPSGEFAGYIGSCTDITERKLAERELAKAVNLRDEFLSIASHELKTPITSLKLQVQLLRHTLGTIGSTEAVARIGKAVDMSERQIAKLTELVQDLLDVSRLSAGRLTLTYQTVELGTLVRDVVERLSGLARVAGSTVDLRIQENVAGNWDHLRIEQVVVNLLTNAIKYGLGKPIVISVTKRGGGARISVRDQGIGIAKDQVGRIFDRFARAVSAEHFGGLGLGLYIAREIIKAHGGRICVESEPGAGAEFIAELPLVPATPLAEARS